VVFTPTDSTNYNIATATVTINVRPQGPLIGPAHIVVTRTLARDSQGNVVATATLTNDGGVGAQTSLITVAVIGSTPALLIPKDPVNVGPGASVQSTLVFPGSVEPPEPTPPSPSGAPMLAAVSASPPGLHYLEEPMNRYTTVPLAAIALALSAPLYADPISVNLTSPTLSGAPGSRVTFNGILMNTTASTVFLNAAGVNLAGFLPADEDTGPFFANAPLSLLGGASTAPIGLFTIHIPNPFPAGSYPGTFTVLGGADANAESIVGSASFTVQLNGVPEPATGVLVAVGVAALIGRRIHGRRNLISCRECWR
jgi:hypothetical protein